MKEVHKNPFVIALYLPLSLIVLIALSFSSCKKQKTEPIVVEPTKTIILKENPNITPPPFAAVIVKRSDSATINIVGDFKYIHFSSYNKIPCPKNDCLNAITHVYNLEYDKLVLDYKVPSLIYDLDFKFVRNSPYSYTFTHKLTNGRSYLLVVHGKDFLKDVVQFDY